MDGRFSPIAGGRSGFAPFGSGYGMGLNFEPGLSPGYGGSANFNSNLSYGRGLNPYYVNSSNRVGGPIGFDGVNGGSSSFFSSATRNLWGSGGLGYGTNSTSSSTFAVAGNGNTGAGNFSNTGVWGSSSISPQGRGNVSNQSGNLGFGGDDSLYGLTGGYGRNVTSSGAPTSSYPASNGSYDGPLADFYSGGLGYSDSTWRSANSERDGSGSIGYGLGNAPSDMPPKNSASYVGSYGVGKRQSNSGKLLTIPLKPEVASPR